MRKMYNFLGRVMVVSLLLVGMTISVTSCVSDEYDLDKEIDMNLNLGGSITIPLGFSLPITLGDMIDDAMGDDGIDYLEKLKDGTYAISMQDSFSPDLGDISNTDVGSVTIPSGSQSFETTFDSVEFGSFDLDVAGEDIAISTGLSTVETTPIEVASDEPIVVDANITTKLTVLSGGSIMPGVSISTLNGGSPLDVSLGDENIVNTLSLDGDGMECPSTVKEVSGITFKGDAATITLDVSHIAEGFTNFEMAIPYLKITFPEGFVLSCDNPAISLSKFGSGEDAYYVVIANNITLTNSAPSYDIEFTIDSYGKTLVNNVVGDATTGTLDAISGSIECELYKEFTLDGTTTGDDFDDQISITIDASVDIDDMSLKVEGLEIKVDDQNNIGGTSKIYLGEDDLIKSISSVTLESANNQNQLNIDIDAVNIVDGLAITDSSIEIWFPVENFKITESSVVTKDSGDGVYKLSIPLDDIIDNVSDSSEGSGFDEVITLEQILFDDTDPDQIKLETEDVEQKGEYYIEFTPNVSIKGATIAMGGDVKLSDYNTFVAKYEDEQSGSYVGEQNISTKIEAVNKDGLAIASAEAVITGYTADIEAQEIAISPDEVAIDEAIEAIYRLDIYSGDVDAPEKVYVNFDIVVDIDLSATGAPKLSFDNYKIMLPTFLEFADDLDVVSKEVEIDDVKVTRDFQVITLDGDFTPTVVNGKNVCLYSASYEITAIDFDSYKGTILDVNSDDEQVLALSDLILLEGGVEIGEGTIDSNLIGSAISGSATYTIDEMSISKISGVIDPGAQEGFETIGLDDLADALDGEVSIVLSNPTIDITVVNSFDIPLSITELVLTTYVGGESDDSSDDSVAAEPEAVEKISLSEPIVIDAASEISVHISSVVESGTEYDKYVQMAGLENLLSTIPDYIEMSYSAGVVKGDDIIHTIDLTRGDENPYTFDFEYELNIPLAFESFSFEYPTQIDGLSGDLADVVEYVDELELILDVNSTLPINLSVNDIVVLDAEGNTLSGLVIINDGDDNFVIAANDSSTIKLTIANNDADDLLLLDGLELNIHAYIDGESGGEFHADDSISIAISVCVPNGFNVDLNEM